MKRPTTVTIETEILQVLDQVAQREERSRSWAVNCAIRQWVATRTAPVDVTAPVLATEASP
jgi:predicted transcriptional regulator